MSLYRRYFTPEEIALLDATPRDDLTIEINLLRVLLARLLEASQHAKDLALKQNTAILAALSQAGATIARIVHVQCELHNPLDALQKAIEQGKELARQHRHVHDYFSFPASA